MFSGAVIEKFKSFLSVEYLEMLADSLDMSPNFEGWKTSLIKEIKSLHFRPNACIIYNKSWATLVIMLVVPHHENCVSDKRGPSHGSIKYYIFLLIHCTQNYSFSNRDFTMELHKNVLRRKKKTSIVNDDTAKS